MRQRDPRCSELLTEGWFLRLSRRSLPGESRSIARKDGWTVRTRDRPRSAHDEHTVALMRDGARLLTA